MAKNPEHRDLFPGALEIMVLQTLRLRPMHGYALVKHIKQVSDNLLQIEEGSLYPALQRLELQKLITAKWQISETGRRARFYKLTAAGRNKLVSTMSRWEDFVTAIGRVLHPAESPE